jgi:hypothetical protein
MAKAGKELKQNKEQQFDELIQENWYYNEVYTYLLKFENEFTNLSLIDFILNCQDALSSVYFEIGIIRSSKQSTLKFIIDNRKFYDNKNKLNDFELYLTKFIVAHCMVSYYKENKNMTDYFNQVLSICKSQSNNYKYYFDYHRGFFCTGNEWGVCADWHLRLNTHQYVTIDKKELTETLNKLKQTNTQPTPPQKEIKPIKWLKNSNLLAYLINELKDYGFIDDESIWAICEQIFVDKKGNPIKAETFTSMVKNYENNQTPDGTKGKPKTHTEITELIKTLKVISKGIE